MENLTEAAREQEIKDKGLVAPRLTPEIIDATIVDEYYHIFPNNLMVCALTLKNGFTVTGESAPASPSNFDEELGRKIARTKARDKIWMLEGYLLRQKLYEQIPPPANEQSNLQRYAESELRRAGLFDKDSDYDGMIGPAVMRMIDVFANERHSGFSSGLVINIFKKIAEFKPLTPLTGEDDEWTEINNAQFGEEDLYQNKRYSAVFKKNGEAYNLDGKVFQHPDGSCFTSKDSRVPITFPYTPHTEYVQVEALPETAEQEN